MSDLLSFIVPLCFTPPDTSSKPSLSPSKLRHLTAAWILDAAPHLPTDCAAPSALYRSLFFSEKNSCEAVGVGVVERMPWLLNAGEGRVLLERLKEQRRKEDEKGKGGWGLFGAVFGVFMLWVK